MILATTQLGTVKHIALLDITVKTACEPIGKLLAPTWQLVGGYKRWQAQRAADWGQPINLNAFFDDLPPLSWDEYSEKYTELLRYRYGLSQKPFLDLLGRSHAILGCYCHDHSHCHRALAGGVLVKIATSVGVECGWQGERTLKENAQPIQGELPPV